MQIKNNNCISLIAAGGDLAIHKAYENGIFDYYMYDYGDKNKKVYGQKKIKPFFNRHADRIAVKAADIIIPSLYEYSIGYSNISKLNKVIPFPINTDSIKYNENKLNGKIVFFHGINDELLKGTAFIRKALEKL